MKLDMLKGETIYFTRTPINPFPANEMQISLNLPLFFSLFSFFFCKSIVGHYLEPVTYHYYACFHTFDIFVCMYVIFSNTYSNPWFHTK